MASYEEVFSPLTATRAAFRTHQNYIQCLERCLATNEIEVVRVDRGSRDKFEVDRYQKLHDLSNKSIVYDIEGTRANPLFGEVVAPWFSVKCYYALYYLESQLCHITDGDNIGFQKGGHGKIRKHIPRLIRDGKLCFSKSEVSRVYPLSEIKIFPRINSGENAERDFYTKPKCIDALARKLMEYKLDDAKDSSNWNLRRREGKSKKADYVAKEYLMLIDFFYWYRLRANYRDLDYINFDVIDKENISDYLGHYYLAYGFYRQQLLRAISKAKTLIESWG